MTPNESNDRDRAQEWVNSLSWPDMLIALCFPRFFRKYAPDEIKEQWDSYLEKRRKRRK